VFLFWRFVSFLAGEFSEHVFPDYMFESSSLPPLPEENDMRTEAPKQKQKKQLYENKCSGQKQKKTI
jgi:hypothetical protein